MTVQRLTVYLVGYTKRSIRKSLILLVSMAGIGACGGGGGGSAAPPAPPPPPPDVTAPDVMSSAPSAGASDVIRDGSISVTFTENVSATTVTSNSFFVDNGVTGTISYDPGTNTATLTPDKPLAVITTYTVTVTPDITDPAGNALDAETSWSFTTVDASFGIDAVVDVNMNDTWDPQVAIDDDGNAIAVWVEDNGMGTGFFDVWARRYVASNGTWDTAIELGYGGYLAGPQFGGDPQVAFDSDGNAIVVWGYTFSPAGNSVIVARRYTVEDDAWSAEVTIGDTAGTRNRIQFPQIGIDSSGNAIIVWEQEGPSFDFFSIQSSRYTVADDTWSQARPLEFGGGSATEVQIAVDGDGNAIVVWSWVISGGNDDIVYVRYAVADDSWTLPVSLRTKPPMMSWFPQISMDPDGNAIVVWQQYDITLSQFEMRATHFTTADGMWSAPATIDAGTGNALNADIDFDASGNAMAVWQQDGASGIDDIFVSFYTAAGDSWSTPGIIDIDDGIAGLPKIAVDPAGNAIVVWEQDDGTGIFDVQATRYTVSDDLWSPPLILDSGAGTIFDPQISINDAGLAIVVWEQDDETGIFDVLSAWFD
jgi:hypothetical protein